MSMAEILKEFSKASPLPVMARVAIEHATSDEFLNHLFAENAQRQVEGELLFSAVVKLMTLVACRVRRECECRVPEARARCGRVDPSGV